MKGIGGLEGGPTCPRVTPLPPVFQVQEVIGFCISVQDALTWPIPWAEISGTLSPGPSVLNWKVTLHCPHWSPSGAPTPIWQAAGCFPAKEWGPQSEGWGPRWGSKLLQEGESQPWTKVPLSLRRSEGLREGASSGLPATGVYLCVVFWLYPPVGSLRPILPFWHLFL